MKQLTFTILLFTIGLFLQAQPSDFDIKATQKTLAKINDSLYASKTEVTNKQYTTFLNLLKQDNQTDKYITAKIDSAKWSDKHTYNEPYVQYYHTHPAYADYPVVNISYEGATLFCEWLTEQYNSNDKRKFKKVKFRLPTKDEWITAAKGGNPTATYPWDGKDLQTKNGSFHCNFKRAASDTLGIAGKMNDNADITAPVQSYWPNKYGLYNMSGNVAEMLADKGHTKGGSWLDTAEAMKIDGKSKYSSFDSPKPTIGFRYFMEVIEK